MYLTTMYVSGLEAPFLVALTQQLLYKTLILHVTKLIRGGAIEITQQSYLLMRNCRFADNHAEDFGGAVFVGWEVILKTNRSYFLDNSAGVAGAIFGANYVKLDVQETSFVGNNALWVGAIHVETQTRLRVTNCLFDNNTSRQRYGTIYGETNVTLEIQATNFTRNSVVDGGAINVGNHVQLSLRNCKLKFNIASDTGGAINAGENVKMTIQETSLTGNCASGNGGALYIVSHVECYVVRCVCLMAIWPKQEEEPSLLIQNLYLT